MTLTSSLFWLIQIKDTEIFEIMRTASCVQILNMLIEKLYRWYLLKYLTLLDLLECDEIWYLSSNDTDLSTLLSGKKMRQLEVDLTISLKYNLIEFVLCTKVSDFLSILGDPSNAIFHSIT